MNSRLHFLIVSILIVGAMTWWLACSKKKSTNPVDTTNPAIASITPTDGAVRVATNARIVIHFTEAINPASVLSTSVVCAPAVAGTIAIGGDSITFTPNAPFNFATAYTVTVDAGVTDAAGNALGTDYVWSFTTKANTWLRSFVSQGERLGYGGRVMTTPDHGFIVASGTCLRVDSLGTTVWERSDIGAYDIAPANDGTGYLVLSGPFDDTSMPPPTLTRLNTSGQTVWEVTVAARTDATKLCANPLQNCYFLIGIGTDSGVTATNVMKVSNSGSLVWQQWYRGSTGDGFSGHALCMKDGGDMLVAGEQGFAGATDPAEYIMQIEPTTGSILWDLTYSAQVNSELRVFSITTDIVGGMITSGYYYPGAGNYVANMYLRDLGNPSRQFNKGFTFSGYAESQYATPTPDAGFVLTGSTYVTGVGARLMFIKTDFQGNEQWRRTLVDTLAPSAQGTCVLPVTDDGYIVLGNGTFVQPTLGILLKVDSEGRY